MLKKNSFWRRTKSPCSHRMQLQVEALECRAVPSATLMGPSSSATPYVVPTAAGVEITSIMTVGDSVNNKPDGVTPYRAVGIMDGLGAFDNGNGTFTLVMNHEIPVNIGAGGVANPVGGVRAHGNAGAFVSLWTIRKSDLKVLNVEDLLQNNTSIFLSNNNPDTGTVHTAYLAGDTTALARLCSADLAPITAYAFVDPTTGQFYGTTARIFQTGEESSGVATSISIGDLGPEAAVHFGRQWNMILTDDPLIPGNQARTAFEMPNCGLFSWENNLANPLSQRITITAGMDDGNPTGQVYFWIGEKQQTGNVVERAGLTRQSTDDNLWVVKVPSLATVDGSGVPIEDRATPVSGAKGTSAAFQLVKSGVNGDTSGITFAQLEADSDSKGATQFFRPEDGQWDPNNPSDYYFVTTDRYDQVKDGVGAQEGRSRLYRLRFADIAHPELGGTITCLLDGTEAGNMFDNMTIDKLGRILIQEDVGNQQHNSKIWMYDIASGAVLQLAQHDPARFGNIGVPATAPFNLDEESSGIIDVSDILGSGTYLLDVQAHFNPGDAELVEGGQLLMMKVNVAAGIGFDAADNTPALVVFGTSKNDKIEVDQHGDDFVVKSKNHTLGTFTGPVDKIFALGYDGNDDLDLRHVDTRVIAWGGSGNDEIRGGDAHDYLNGGDGNDDLKGGWGDDILVGGNGNDDLDSGPGADIMQGGFGNDDFYYDLDDTILDFGVGKDKKKRK